MECCEKNREDRFITPCLQYFSIRVLRGAVFQAL